MRQIARRPDDGRAHVGGEDRVVGRRLVQGRGDILRMKRLAGSTRLGEVVQPSPGADVVQPGLLEEGPAAPRWDRRRERRREPGDIGDDRQVERDPPPQRAGGSRST